MLTINISNNNNKKNSNLFIINKKISLNASNDYKING